MDFEREGDRAEPSLARRTPVRTLGYGRPVTGFRARRQVRVLWFIAMANVLLAGGILWEPTARDMQRARWDRHLAAVAARQQALAVAAIRKGWIDARRRIIATERSWLTYSPPPGTVVYEEAHDEIGRLLSGPTAVDYSSLTIRRPADPQIPSLARCALPLARNESDGWQQAPPAGLDHSDQHTVFLHELTSRGGNRRLVCVGVAVGCNVFREQASPGHVTYCITLDLHFIAAVYTTTRMVNPEDVRGPFVAPRDATDRWCVWFDRMKVRPTSDPSRSVHVRCVPAAKEDANALPVFGCKPLRLYAGQVDPRDKSHFTIDYVFGTRRGILDGWLLDDERLRFEPRDGTLTGDSVRDYSRRAMINNMAYAWDPDGTSTDVVSGSVRERGSDAR